MAVDASVGLWARSGAMALTGRPGEAPSLVPADVALSIDWAASDLAMMTRQWGAEVIVDGPALLGERAAILGHSRNGDVSLGGSARFLRALDGAIVLNLARPEDMEVLPALIGKPIDPGNWSALAAALADRPRDDILADAIDLGLAAAIPGERAPVAWPARELFLGGPRTPSNRPLVVDLTSLWAGPLLTSLLMDAGARVIKVEGHRRPDGSRAGSPEFYDLLNYQKECLAIDFADRDDIRLLRRLLGAADLVVEGSRPRVMELLGIDPRALATSGTSWLSITGHGRTGLNALRVGFGDDAAVAGGLMARDQRGLMFVGDAVADPLTGVAGATIGAELLAAERAAVIEVPLARVAAWAVGSPCHGEVIQVGQHEWAVEVDGDRVPVAAPRCRPRRPGAAEHNAHGVVLRREFADE